MQHCIKRREGHRLCRKCCNIQDAEGFCTCAPARPDYIYTVALCWCCQPRGQRHARTISYHKLTHTALAHLVSSCPTAVGATVNRASHANTICVNPPSSLSARGPTRHCHHNTSSVIAAMPATLAVIAPARLPSREPHRHPVTWPSRPANIQASPKPRQPKLTDRCGVHLPTQPRTVALPALSACMQRPCTQASHRSGTGTAASTDNCGYAAALRPPHGHHTAISRPPVHTGWTHRVHTLDSHTGCP